MTSLIAPVIRHLAGAIAGLGLVTAATLAVAQEPPNNFVLHETPKPVPEIDFRDGEGAARSLTDFRGQVVLLNIWATWCVPCRHEMPTLDRLQSELGGADFDVVALSIDRAGIEAVRRFFDEIGIKHLALHIDSTGKAARQLGTVGLPTTLLVDRKGREIGRLVGPAEWDSPGMVAFFRQHLSWKSGALRTGATIKLGGRAAIHRAGAIELAGIFFDRRSLTFRSLETPPLL